MREILKLAGQTKDETDGYFDIFQNGKMDPSGIVKGWAIHKAARLINESGHKNFSVEAGGDVQTKGNMKNENGKIRNWKVGIRNPFNVLQIVKVLYLSGEGIATSGTYERGEHIYNPHTGDSANEIASMSVIAENVYEADRFATAAFAMGGEGINFVERKKGLEGYIMIRYY